MIKFTAIPITLDAAAGDAESPRTITGVAVPWDVKANVSSGESVLFLRGAFDTEGKRPKLLENHDPAQLRGVIVELADSEEGLLFTAKFAKTRASDDAIELVKAGAYDSVSVGAYPVKFTIDKSGTMIVSEARLEEISLVASPAFSEAQITQIAASEPDPEVEPETTETQPQDTSEEEPMSNETPVEASAPDVVHTAPLYASAKPAFKLPSASEWISAQLQGGVVAAEFNARLRAAAPDVVTGDLPGIMPVPIIGEIYNNFQAKRPLVDATILRAMPQSGAVFIRPVVSVHSSIGTATQNTTITASAFEVNDVQINKTIQGGYVELSEASVDWSSPEVLGALLDDMARIYADRTDLLACSELETGTTNSNAFANASIQDPAYWVEWMYTAAADILNGSNGNLPSVLAVSPNVWKYLGALSDTSDRPLFPQVGPMNAYGSASVSSDSATAFGLKVVVDRNITATGMYIMDPTCLENYEQQKGSISVEMPSQLSRQIAFRGYWASKVIDPTKTIKAAFA